MKFTPNDDDFLPVVYGFISNVN